MPAGQAAAREVAIGVFAWQGERAAIADWSPVLRDLNAALPEHRFRLDHYDAAGLRRGIAEHRVDLVITIEYGFCSARLVQVGQEGDRCRESADEGYQQRLPGNGAHASAWVLHPEAEKSGAAQG